MHHHASPLKRSKTTERKDSNNQEDENTGYVGREPEREHEGTISHNYRGTIVYVE